MFVVCVESVGARQRGETKTQRQRENKEASNRLRREDLKVNRDRQRTKGGRHSRHNIMIACV